MSSTYILAYTRKELLKMCKGSPFTAPIAKKNNQQIKGSLLKRLSAEYGGVVAFEINLHNIEGLDYSNTHYSYGCRLTLEVNKAQKLWFSNTLEFCKHYKIYQTEINTKYYSPILDENYKYFNPKQIDPKNNGYSKAKTHRVATESNVNKKAQIHRIVINDYTAKTPEIKCSQVKHRKSLSHVNIEELLYPPEESQYEQNSHECDYCHFTIAAYFDDPIFPYFVKNILKKPKNKYLLTMYERGLPSWAQFLPSYGLPYRP